MARLRTRACYSSNGTTNRSNVLVLRSIRYCSDFSWSSASIVLIAALGMVLSVLYPRLLGRTLDAVVGRNLKLVYSLLLAVLGILLLQALQSLMETYLLGSMTGRIAWRAKKDLYTRVISLPARRYDTTQQGEFLSRIENDVGALNALLSNLLRLVPESIRTVVILVLIFRLSFLLSVVQLAIIPFLYATSSVSGRALKRLNLALRQLSDRYFGFVQETLAANREVKSLQLEQDRVRRFAELAKDLWAASMSITVTQACSGLSNLVIGGLGSVAILGFAARQIATGDLTIGELIAFTMYAAQLSSALKDLTGFVRLKGELSPSLERLFSLLDEDSEDPSMVTGHPIRVLRGRVLLRNVSFSYGDGGPRVLDGVTCEFEPGQITGLMGSNGSGKTTLLNLLSRLYTPQTGMILIDGQDIRNVDLKSLRRAISVVHQEPAFFRTTILENMLLANQEATPAEVERACELAGAAAFIRDFPKRYETVLSDRGASLSGGQRQRLALARALLRRSPILLCDEATSAVDVETEAQIMTTLKELAPGHNIILVSHRPSAIMHTDKVLVLEQGRIRHMGVPREILDPSLLEQRPSLDSARANPT